MIDHELRSTLIGASEVAQILGLSPWGDAFTVWARKVGGLKDETPKPWLRRGKRFEKTIIEWYGEQTGLTTEWSDETVSHPTRQFQGCTPDAFILDAHGVRIAGVDAKSVNFQHREEFGESDSDIVPIYYAIQNHWTLSTLDKPYWDIAAALSLDELRIYRIHRDAEIEATLLEEIEPWWRRHIVNGEPPVIGHTQSAADYLKQRYPKNLEQLRTATPEEHELLVKLKDAGDRWDAIHKECTALENAVKLAIASGDGLLDGPARVTWKKDRDSMGTDYEAIAKELHAEAMRLGSQIELSDLLKAHQVVTRAGARKLIANWSRRK